MTKDDAIEYFGSPTELAHALGIRVQAVSQWDEIPEARQWQLEVVTNARLRVDPELREANRSQ